MTKYVLIAVAAIILIIVIYKVRKYMMGPPKQNADPGSASAAGQYQSNTTGTGITNGGSAAQNANNIKPPTVYSSPKDLYFAELYKLPHAKFPLKVGSYGQEVGYLQYMLKELVNPGIVVDAKMGSITMTAANSVQKTSDVNEGGQFAGTLFPSITKAEYEDINQQYMKKKAA